MSRTLLAYASLAAALLLAACAQLTSPGAGTIAPASSHIHFDEAAFDAAIEDALDGLVRGYAATLVNADGIQARVAGGWAQAPGDGDVEMDTDIASLIGSVSKVLSGIALLDLFDKHALGDNVQEQLDLEVWPYLPQKWQDTYGGAGYNFDEVTFRDLLQHRSGFRIGMDGQPSLPNIASGHQMHWMISQDVNASDMGDRFYNNFNFTILLYLIPAIAYPDQVETIHDSFESLDVVEYSKQITIFYGVLYEQYMQQEIFPDTVRPVDASCRPLSELPSDGYAKSYSGVLDFAGDVEDPTFCRSQGGWYLSMEHLAAFAETYAFANTYIGPVTRASLFDWEDPDERLLYNRTLDYEGFALDQSVFAYHGGTQREHRSALIELPYGYFGVATTNSANLPDGTELGSGDVAQILIEAFDAAIEDTPPEITGSLAGQLGRDNWYISDVDVTWTVVEPDSPISSRVDCDPQTYTTDTTSAGTTLTCTATSLGGTGSGSVAFKRDATPPTATLTGVVDGASYPAADPPDVGCIATDPAPGSGIVNPDGAIFIIDLGEGWYEVRCVAIDGAGNGATTTSTYRLVSLDLIVDAVEAASLNGGQMNSLLEKLERAQDRLDLGRTRQAVNAMNAFRNEVVSLMEGGDMPADEGQALLDDIDLLIDFYG